ncbi:MAG: hypothetical protein IJ598_09910 [Ruminococcus sp.]|nr:hypothetical protein [Ruminococcus sp.]
MMMQVPEYETLYRTERKAEFENEPHGEKAERTDKGDVRQPEFNNDNQNGQAKLTEPQTSADYSAESETSNAANSETASSNSSNTSSTVNQAANSGDVLLEIDNPDANYSPSQVTFSDYDRAKLERLVMGEAGSMGYTGCALVAQAIRDAMNLSGTSSIDEIISDYGYYGSTSIEPNADVKAAVSYIFDENGSAVQHRVLCFYIGSSAWHETQNFVVELDGVRFFDMYV